MSRVVHEVDGGVWVEADGLVAFRPLSPGESAWRSFKDEAVQQGTCPYSGLPGPDCKKSICDCFEFPEWELDNEVSIQ